jgi:hypothetical protein
MNFVDTLGANNLRGVPDHTSTNPPRVGVQRAVCQGRMKATRRPGPFNRHRDLLVLWKTKRANFANVESEADLVFSSDRGMAARTRKDFPRSDVGPSHKECRSRAPVAAFALLSQAIVECDAWRRLRFRV